MKKIERLIRFATQTEPMSNKVNFACLYLWGNSPTSMGELLQQSATLQTWATRVSELLNNMCKYGIWKVDETDEVLRYWHSIERSLPTTAIGESLFRKLINHYDSKRKAKTIERSVVYRLLQKI